MAEALSGIPHVQLDRPWMTERTNSSGLLWWVALSAAALLMGAGCASAERWLSRGWVADYETAERRMHETGRDLLILYKETRPGTEDAVERTIQSAPVRERSAEYVRCRLYKSFEPDRRYMAQYGVERAPALVVVHGDGTYHSSTSWTSPTEVVRFLAGAEPPGAVPALNRYLPRRAPYDWHDDLESARQASEASDRPMLVVYYRRFSRQWHALAKLLNRREVYSRLAEMVHCRVGAFRLGGDEAMTPFGKLELPAIVIVGQTGTSEAMELPMSYEAVVRFVDAALGAAPTGGIEAATATEP